MKFRKQQFEHGQKTRIGILITNLGTPSAPTAKALRPYLKQFLSDPRVVEVPRLLWWLVLNGIILRFRPKRSAKAYASVWTKEGSPLSHYTAEQARLLREELQAEYGDNVVLEWGMRYGQPSIAKASQSLLDQGADRLLVLPLYPQYSASTTASTFDALSEDFRQRRWLPQLRFISGYQQDGGYINALVESIKEHWQEHGRQEHLLFSYHGLPMRYLHAGDPYHCFCLQTTRAVAEKLGLNKEEYSTTFQSRFGREPWLQPYTDFELKRRASEGLKSIAVICPGFSADCLETLEEIKIENKEYFLGAGGKAFFYIPALNTRPEHIQALAQLCKNNLGGWLESNEQINSVKESYKTHPHNQVAK
ncbi:ferrochelatase [Agaribacterium sp. ZY112]|uniref:ferrochelatase n=1 Tax=Agaribacterium sp. ZY112 TaxID=3233574 RepID=UPI003524EDFC